MVMASTEGASRYSIRARFGTTGAVAALKRARFDVSAKGRKASGRFVPQSYSEETEEGRRSTNLRIAFSGGVATKVSGDTGSSAPPADPARLRGALDPLTGLYAALRDQSPAELCTLDADIYDGHRHARLVLTAKAQVSGGVRCSGQYQRIAGYSDREMRHRTAPVSVVYGGNGDVMQAILVTVRTRYGKVTMHRR